MCVKDCQPIAKGFCVYFLCVLVFYLCVCVHHVCAWYLKRSEEDVQSPRTRVSDDFEPSSVFWELNGCLRDHKC